VAPPGKWPAAGATAKSPSASIFTGGSAAAYGQKAHGVMLAVAAPNKLQLRVRGHPVRLGLLISRKLHRHGLALSALLVAQGLPSSVTDRYDLTAGP
jgi:hypothetical protein